MTAIPLVLDGRVTGNMYKRGMDGQAQGQATPPPPTHKVSFIAVGFAVNVGVVCG